MEQSKNFYKCSELPLFSSKRLCHLSVVVNLVLEFFFSGDLSSFCCSPATFPIASSRKINAAAISMLLKLRIRNNPFVLWI
ncbi:hypothetical protein RB195_012988 [Necator americanus]|uniref:Uncharacterized protein n=1 Tax=Necator americanus TaxID=51031 RepID=A0ABR1DTQ4_NECAM